MIADQTTYEVTNYKNYDGPGFSRFKNSENFARMGWRRGTTYTKQEVAAYSEMTKLALLAGMAILMSMVIWFDYIVINYFAQSFDWHGMVAMVGFFGLLPLNVMMVSFWPKAVFLVKNFRDING